MVKGCIQISWRLHGNNHAKEQKSPILDLWHVLPFPSGALEGGLWKKMWLMPSLWEEENMIVHSFLVPSIIPSDAHGEAYFSTGNICRTNFQKIRVTLNKKPHNFVIIWSDLTFIDFLSQKYFVLSLQSSCIIWLLSFSCGSFLHWKCVVGKL